MVPFAGYDMPVQYPLGILAEHLVDAREAPACSTSPTWARRFSTGPDAAAGARERWCPPTSSASRPAAALHAAAQRGRRHPRRPDGHAPARAIRARSGCCSSSTPRCKEADFAHICARSCRSVRLDARSTTARCSPCRGRKAAEVARRPRSRRRRLPFMGWRQSTFEGVAASSSRAPAIPARTVSRSRYARQRARAFANALLADAEVEADRPRRARFAAARGRALPLRPRHRRRRPSPVEAGLVWSIGKRRRERGRLSRRSRASQRELADGPSRMRVGLLPEGRAPAREGAQIADAGRRDRRRRHVGRLRAEPRRGRSPWATSTPRIRAPGTELDAASCAASRCPRSVVALALRPASLRPD